MENFVVSARKYRPATFESVVGQGHITSTLRNAITRGQLAHAYLFCGPRGVGKTTCARIFAKAINCFNLTAEGEACNDCESCRSFNEGRSFNIHELDAASNNSVDDIRNLTDQVRIPPQVGRYSIYIIDEVHMLSQQAFNAFLKTLEEPPAHAVFILATTEKHKIIPTILSRCQIYDFNRIRVEDTVGYLKYIAGKEEVAYDDESLHIIAQKADGGMRDALSMFDKVVSFCGPKLSIADVAGVLNELDYDTYFKVTEHILGGNYTEALLLFDEVLRKGFSGQTFVAGLNNHFRDLLMCKNPQTLPLLEVTGSVAERYRAQATQCPVPLLFEGIALLTSVDGSLRTATNQRLHVELGLMKLCGLGQKKNNEFLTPELPPLVAPGGAPGAERTTASVAPPAGDSSLPGSSAVPQAAPTPPPAPPANDAPPVPSATTLPVAETPPPVSQPRKPSENSPKAQPASAPAKGGSPVSISGRSIHAILKSQPADNQTEAPEEPEETEGEADGAVESLLTEGCAQFARELMVKRPRMGNLFEEATISGNRVRLQVPNESSYDELMNSLTEMKGRLGALSGIKGTIEFEVRIAADTRGLKPIKMEDRLQYLAEKNPLLNELRRQLELEAE